MKGRFIVIEGSDGSGKGTQFNILLERLQSEGHQVATFDFPQYGQPSAYFVEKYLNGDYGTAEEIGPYKGSMFYAMDRFEASYKIRKAITDGVIVLANRYVGSNMGHQGGKIKDVSERKAYFEWLDRLEFETLGIPRPDANIVLHIPAAIAQELVDHKAKRDYLKSGKRDLHEADLEHLKNAEKVYLEICEMFPENFTRISCVIGGKLLSIEEVSEIIWKHVELLLRRQNERQ